MLRRNPEWIIKWISGRVSQRIAGRTPGNTAGSKEEINDNFLEGLMDKHPSVIYKVISIKDSNENPREISGESFFFLV